MRCLVLVLPALLTLSVPGFSQTATFTPFGDKAACTPFGRPGWFELKAERNPGPPVVLPCPVPGYAFGLELFFSKYPFHRSNMDALFLLVGTSRTNWKGTSLPAAVPWYWSTGSGFHQKKCLLVSPTVVFPLSIPPSLSRSCALWIPQDPSLLGACFYTQAMAFTGTSMEWSFFWSNGGKAVVGKRCAGTGTIVENFSGALHLDRDATGAIWGGGSLKPGRLGDTGILGDLDVTSGTVTLNTDYQVFGASRTLTGKNITVKDGIFRFARVFVAPGATLRFTGTRPARMLVRGSCRIEGTIDVSGEPGPVTDASKGVHSGGKGGRGGPGGARGGAGGNHKGFGPVDGSAGGDLLVPPGHPRANRAGGTGGKGSRANPPGADPKKITYNWYATMSQQVAGGGGGGGFMTAGGTGSSKVLYGPAADAGPGGVGGKAFPLLPLASSPPSSFQLLLGGSGGGGAGIHPSGSCSGKPQWHVGAGGGGGGGAFLLQAGGDFTLGTRGRIFSLGGDGGRSKAWTDASPGGAGSGGSILLQVQGAVKLQGRVDVSGGKGQTTNSLLVGWKSTSGGGAPGFIRLEHDPPIPFTSITGFVPPAGKDNSALLQERDSITGARSTWYDTPPSFTRWISYEIRARQGAQVVTYSDDPAKGILPRLGTTPVAFFLQGARRDAWGKPTSMTPWVTKASLLNGFNPVPLSVRFTIVLDSSRITPGLVLEVLEVKIHFRP